MNKRERLKQLEIIMLEQVIHKMNLYYWRGL